MLYTARSYNCSIHDGRYLPEFPSCSFCVIKENIVGTYFTYERAYIRNDFIPIHLTENSFKRQELEGGLFSEAVEMHAHLKDPHHKTKFTMEMD